MDKFMEFLQDQYGMLGFYPAMNPISFATPVAQPVVPLTGITLQHSRPVCTSVSNLSTTTTTPTVDATIVVQTSPEVILSKSKIMEATASPTMTLEEVKKVMMNMMALPSQSPSEVVSIYDDLRTPYPEE